MAKRVASGKPKPGEQRNQQIFLTDVVTFTGSTIVSLSRAIRRRGGAIDFADFHIIGVNFQDAGGAATVHRLATQKNTDGTFTINASKETGVAGTYATATNPCTVRWSVLAL